MWCLRSRFAGRAGEETLAGGGWQVADTARYASLRIVLRSLRCTCCGIRPASTAVVVPLLTHTAPVLFHARRGRSSILVVLASERSINMMSNFVARSWLPRHVSGFFFTCQIAGLGCLGRSLDAFSFLLRLITALCTNLYSERRAPHAEKPAEADIKSGASEDQGLLRYRS